MGRIGRVRPGDRSRNDEDKTDGIFDFDLEEQMLIDDSKFFFFFFGAANVLVSATDAKRKHRRPVRYE